jgi:F-type H+-transporting ATPase subunit a
MSDKLHHSSAEVAGHIEHEAKVIDPLHQFEIHSILDIQVAGFDISFTNSALWMVISAAVGYLLLTFAMRNAELVPGRLQNVGEMLYGIVAGMIRDNIGDEGKKYFPIIFTLFMFVLFGNVLGMIPGSFTFTSHLIVTFTMASVIFVVVTIIGIVRHGWHFLRLFFPEGAPAWTAVILVPIELVSYLSRPISLSVRLFANMMVGHTLLKVLGGFAILMGAAGVLPVALLVGITALEFLVAALQAYVFTILTCIYLHDAIHLH